MSNITKQQFAFKVTAVWGLLLFIVLIKITQSQEPLIYNIIVTFIGMCLVFLLVYHIFLEEYKSEVEEE